MKKLLSTTVPRKEDKEQLANDQFRDAINHIKNAAKDGDTAAVPVHLRNIVSVS